MVIGHIKCVTKFIRGISFEIDCVLLFLGFGTEPPYKITHASLCSSVTADFLRNHAILHSNISY